MDEYEILEKDMQRVYDEYMLKFRNMAYLEQILEDYHKTEAARSQVILNRIHGPK